MLSFIVTGPATVEIFDGPVFSVNTTKLLQITGTVDGQPDPNVTLSKIENGSEVEVPIDHPRITVDFMDTKLIITVINVHVKDSGKYLVKAKNVEGENQAMFTIATQGERRAISKFTYLHIYSVLSF